jgi:putative lipoprotein
VLRDGVDLGYTLRMFTFVKRLRAVVCTMAPALILSLSTTARAADDPFWGPDKALHFAVAGTIAGVGYAATTAATDDRWKAFAIGGGAALGAGALKEGLDAAGMGDPSWKDFAWDAIGAVCGLGAAWLIDVAIQGHAPPLSASAPTALVASKGARLAVSF